MRQKFHNSINFGALAIALMLGTAMVTDCENPYVMKLKDEFGWTGVRILNDGWLKTYAIAQPPVYCYNTLGDADCFPKPKREHKDRLTSSS